MDDFKFKIGDLVQYVLAKYESPEQMNALGVPVKVKPRPLLILGRTREECPGGVQLHYRVRSALNDNFVILYEEELEPYAPGVGG